MPNPFDQFDETQNNGNPFDQFDSQEKEASARPREQGYIDRLGEDFDRRIANSQELRGNQDMTAPEKYIGYAGQGLGMVGDVVRQGLRSAYQTLPEHVQESISGGLGDVAKTLQIDHLAPLAKDAVSSYKSFEQNYPRIANPINATGNILDAGLNLSLINPAAKLAGEVAGEAASGIERMGLRSVKNFVSKEKASQLAEKGITEVNESVLKDVKKDYNKFSAAEQQELSEKSKVQFKGVLEKGELKTTPQDIEVAKEAEGLYSPNDHFQVKIDKINKRISELAVQTEEIPEINNLALQTENIEKYLATAKAESSVPFIGDATVKRTYDNAIDTFTKLLEGKPRTLRSVFEARKEFDKLIKNQKKLFEKGSEKWNTIEYAEKDVREAANNFVHDSLPEGNQFKALLKKQSLLYKARKNISFSNTPAIPKGIVPKLQDFVNKHPILVGEMALMSGIGSNFVAGLANPLVMGALLTYGTVKIGKYVVNSSMVRNNLASVLRGAEKILNPTEKAAIQSTINAMPKSPYNFAPQQPRIEYREKINPQMRGLNEQLPNAPSKAIEFDNRGVPVGDAYMPDIIDVPFSSTSTPLNSIEGRLMPRLGYSDFDVGEVNTLRRSKQRLPMDILERRSKYERY
jgi:hypothetical protein